MKRWTVRVLRTVLASVIILALFASVAMASVYARINTKTKVYQSPSKSARSATVKKDLKVKVLDSFSEWAEVSYKGVVAYIPRKYLTLTDPIKVYTACNATVYKYAGSKKLGTLAGGSTVYVIGFDGKYARVKKTKSGSAVGYIRTNDLTRNKVKISTSSGSGIGTDGGTIGSDVSGSTSTGYNYTGSVYVSGQTSSKFSDIPKSLRSTTTSASVSKIEYAIYVAQNLMGAPYQEHSNPPKSFDCATFMSWCFGKAQKDSVRSSAKNQGYDTRYQRITSISALKRGDLVCFNTVVDSDLSDHTGIYLGKGYFLHASSVAKMVVVSTLNYGYYKTNFSWGVRVFNS